MKSRISLDVIDVATPCPADWNEMRGSDRVRFCKHCQLNVYNLSAMSRIDAEELVNSQEGRLCVSFYRRQDGTVITSDCGGGIRFAARRAWRMASGAVAAAACIVLAPLGWGSPSKCDPTKPTEVQPAEVTQVVGGMPPPNAVPIRGEMVMGDVANVFLGKVRAPQPPATQPTPPTSQPADK
jgi:hypothetical protein